MSRTRHIDIASSATILVTLVLFALAVFLKGITHDLLLEAAVFLVSAKLILMSYKHGIADSQLNKRLDRIEAMLARRDKP